MKTVGIVAEYNPFHNGHKHHIAEAKRVSGADRVAVVMSASFIQRGEPACADKFTRAKWAIDGGADMVIELPDVFALSCAERFAGAGVRLLAGTGLVGAIAFGSESGDLGALREAACRTFDREAFEKAMGKGLSYPAARSAAQSGELGPNDILAAEYIRAAQKHCPDAELYAVKRSGSGYLDDGLGGEFSSAKAIRNALKTCSGETRMTPAVFDGLVRAMPRSVLDEIAELMKRGAFPATEQELSPAVLYRFRSMGSEAAAKLPEVSEGLENLFLSYSAKASDTDELLGMVKSKRYTMARLKRTAMCVLLGIDRELQDEAAASGEALYLRVLAVSGKGSKMLAELNEKARLPVIVRSSDREKLPKLASRVEAVSSLAHGIRALGQPYDKSFVPDLSHRLIVRE